VKEEARFGEISSLSVDIRDLRTTVNNVVQGDNYQGLFHDGEIH
jgi:hypothetical protein